jgi:hypothetical protein
VSDDVGGGLLINKLDLERAELRKAFVRTLLQLRILYAVRMHVKFDLSIQPFGHNQAHGLAAEGGPLHLWPTLPAKPLRTSTQETPKPQPTLRRF